MAWKIAVLPGDGIGPEVMDQALDVLAAVGEVFGVDMTFEKALVGGAAIDAAGSALPDGTLALCRASDAILLGSVGGPKWDGLPPEERPELGGLLTLRKALPLYANLRPVVLYPGMAEICPLKDMTAEQGIDLLTVRELAGGIYFGEPKELTEEGGLDTMVYRPAEIERIARIAFEAARRRRGKVTSVDKANVLRSSMCWRETVSRVAQQYPDVAVNHMYVDNAAMQMLLHPAQFDVILTGNLFGDILSDESAALAGSLGMLPSASLGDHLHLFEPAGGSAPDIAGKGVANPIAQILSAAMMLDYAFDAVEEAQAVYHAVRRVLERGLRTGDIAKGNVTPVGTAAMGQAICDAVRSE